MPSERHIELQNIAHRWLKNRAFKMCGLTELRIGSYVADFVGLAGLYSTHHEKYTRELTANRYHICVFEVKVSRSDYLNTFGPNKTNVHAMARKDAAGTLHWVIADKGVCTAEEIPDFWGLLTPYGQGLSEKKRPVFQKVDNCEIHSLAFDLLFAGMNYRDSFFYQFIKLGEQVRSLKKAIIHKESSVGLLRRIELLQKGFRGHAGLGGKDDV